MNIWPYPNLERREVKYSSGGQAWVTLSRGKLRGEREHLPGDVPLMITPVVVLQGFYFLLYKSSSLSKADFVVSISFRQ